MDRAYAFLTKCNVWLARNVFLFKRFEHSAVLEHLSLSPSCSVLDYGCNTGFLADLVSKRAAVAGLDISPVALRMARSAYPHISFSSSFNRKFDRVLLSHVLEHVDDPVSTIRHALAYLRKGGRLVISVPQERFRGEFNSSQILFNAFRGRFCNTHKRKVSLDDLRLWLSECGLSIGRYDYIRLLPPYYSKGPSLFSASLVVSAT